MQQITLTPAAGKRLIARAVAARTDIQAALRERSLVIIAGTTNGYVAEEVLAGIVQAEGFSRRRFYRGVTLPPNWKKSKSGRLPDEGGFPGDVVVVKGEFQPGKQVFDVIDELEEGDIILKGANALDLANRRAGLLIGHPKAGTVGVALQASVGRRVKLLLPVGLEKRVEADLDWVAACLNAPGAHGPRFFPVSGEVITELDALEQLAGVRAELIAAGGVAGAEGAVWLAYQGTPDQEQAAGDLLESIKNEPPFEV